jgi:K+-transporting ATPase ATPase C chain
MKTALKMFVFMTILTGAIYPLLLTFIAQVTMPLNANGSLVYMDNKIAGSALIAQKFSDTKYFWPRPSAIEYQPIPSGGSNLGPTSLKLKEIVKEREKNLGESAPADLLYASGSGLDPHISLQAAYFQIDRIAKARSISSEKLKELVDSHVEGKLFRHKYVNVLILNQMLDSEQENPKIG